jgi:hypothetical protein
MAQSKAATWHPIIGSLVYYIKFGSAWLGVELATSRTVTDSQSLANHSGSGRFLLYKWLNLYISWVKGLTGGKRVGA